MKPRRIIVVLPLLFLTLLAGTWGALKFSFWEPDGLIQGSVAYRLKVSETGKRFPIWSPVGKPLYDVRLADGLSPSLVRIHYQSTSPKRQLRLSLKKLGLNCALLSENSGVFCAGIFDNHSVQIQIHFQESDAKVVAEILGD